MRNAAMAASLLLLIAAGAGCLPGSLTDDGRVADGLTVETVVANARQPAALAFTATGLTFFIEKNTGQIRVLKEGVLQAEVVADIPVNSAQQRGALGLAAHPQFTSNGRLYVCYSRSDTGVDSANPAALVDHRVEYFELVEDPDDESWTAARGPVFVLSLPSGISGRRLGGRIAFGPDAALYVATGDFDAPAAAADPNRLEGKVLRLSDDGTIPADNPNPNSAVFARGLRDPRGLAFDAQGETGFVLDAPATGVSEIHRVETGAHFGWPDVVGVADSAAEHSFADDNPDYREPLLVTGDDAVRTFVGLASNPSGRYGPRWEGHLLYGEVETPRITAAALDELRVRVTDEQTMLTDLPGVIADLGFTPAGTMYVACEDAVLRIAPER